MANPLIHSQSSVKRWGGITRDYIHLHKLIDSVKSTMRNNTSRSITHNDWFCENIIPKIFGNIRNHDGVIVKSSDVALLHVAEDFRMKFIPTPDNYFQYLKDDWSPKYLNKKLNHSKLNVRRYGGREKDYDRIHELMDSPDGLGRIITHNVWFCYIIIPEIFGYTIKNADGKSVNTTDISMQHVSQNFMGKTVPTVQDYLDKMQPQPWMNNGVKILDKEESIKTVNKLLNRIKTVNYE